MNAAGRATTKQQILAGHQMMGGGPIACMCGDSDACSICNADGTDVQQCIMTFTASLETAMATMTTTTTTTTTTTSRDLFLENCALDQGFGGRQEVDLSDTNAYLGMVIAQVVGQCASGNSCQLSPPGTSMVCASSAYYPASDAVGLVTAAEKEAMLTKLCDPQQPLWFNAKNQFLPTSFDCVGHKSKYALSRFYAGAPTEDKEEDAKKFTTGYVEARNGWFQKAAQIEAKYEPWTVIEREHGTKLRIMLFSGATLIAQYLQILAIDAGQDGFLSFGSLISVWAYMWLMLESVFLASCGMFEIVFSLPVGMCLWVIIGQQKIFWYQMLVIYMILGIGADDVFILYDAWLQSAHVEGIKESVSHRFVWAYRRSAMAMMVTTLTTCGSFAIGATSPLPLVQSFCIFAAVVVLVDYLFCISFFAAAVLVYEKFIKGYGCCCSFCGIPLREPGTCLGPGCCWGGFRALFSCCGTSWKCMPKPQEKDAPLEKRAMERFFSGPVFRFYDRHKIKLIIFWMAGDTWCTACAAWEALGSELCAPWHSRALRRLGTDQVVNAVRSLRALRNFSSSLHSAESARAAEKDRQKATRSDPPKQAPPPPPPPPGKEQESSSETDSQESEEAGPDSPGTAAKSKVKKPSRERERVKEEEPEEKAEDKKERSPSRREKPAEEKRERSARREGRPEEKKERSPLRRESPDRRVPAEPKDPPKKKKKKKDHDRSRTLVPLPQGEAMKRAPFVEGKEYSHEDYAEWENFTVLRGQVIETAMEDDDGDFAADLEGGFLVMRVELGLEGDMVLHVKSLGCDDPEATRKLSGLFNRRAGCIHLCHSYPCEVEGDFTLHTNKLKVFSLEGFQRDYITGAMKKQVRKWLDAADEGPPAPSENLDITGEFREEGTPGVMKSTPKAGPPDPPEPAVDKVSAAKREELRRRLEDAKAKMSRTDGGGAGTGSVLPPLESGEPGSPGYSPSVEEEMEALERRRKSALRVTPRRSALEPIPPEALVRREKEPEPKKEKKRGRSRDRSRGEPLAIKDTTTGTLQAQLLSQAAKAAQEKAGKAREDREKAKKKDPANALVSLLRQATGDQRKKKRKKRDEEGQRDGKDAKKDRKDRKRRKKRGLPGDPDSSPSSSNGSGQTSGSDRSSRDSWEEASSSSEDLKMEPPLRKKARERPGSVLQLLVEHARAQLDQSAKVLVGREGDKNLMTGVKIASYFSIIIRPQVGSINPQLREMHLLSSCMDALREGALDHVGDLLAARFISLHQSLLDGNWVAARQLELLPLEEMSAAGPQLILQARKQAKIAAKVTQPELWGGSGAGKGRGGRGKGGNWQDWQQESKGKSKKGAKGKGKNRGWWGQTGGEGFEPDPNKKKEKANEK
eukprot:s86_g20.t1